MMNSMLTAMRSGISAVGRRMGVNLPLPLRKMLEGQLTLASVGSLHVNVVLVVQRQPCMPSGPLVSAFHALI